MSEIDTFSSMLPDIDDVSNMLLNSILLGVRVLGDGNVVFSFPGVNQSPHSRRGFF